MTQLMIISQLFAAVGAFADATKQQDPELVDSTFSTLVDVLQVNHVVHTKLTYWKMMLENCS